MLTLEDARKVCQGIYCTGNRFTDSGIINTWKTLFPEFNWRIILNRSGEYTRFCVTVDDDDKREHYVPIGGTCIHCGKTAKELGVEERDY